MGPPPCLSCPCGLSSEVLLWAWINERLWRIDSFLWQGENTASIGTWMPDYQAISSVFSPSYKERQSRQPQGAGFGELCKSLSGCTLTTVSHGCQDAFGWYSSMWGFWTLLEWAETGMELCTGYRHVEKSWVWAPREVRVWPWRQVFSQVISVHHEEFIARDVD